MADWLWHKHNIEIKTRDKSSNTYRSVRDYFSNFLTQTGCVALSGYRFSGALRVLENMEYNRTNKEIFIKIRELTNFYMDILKARVIITITATLTAILFIILNYFFIEFSVLILSIEIILLPSIYIIGNYYAEKVIKDEYEGIMDNILNEASKLEETNYKLKIQTERLKYELRLINKNGKR